MRLTLCIDSNNEAMQTYEDAAEALKQAARRIEREYSDTGTIIDRNGNAVGNWVITYN
jgi:hypothetical protein